MLGCRRQSPRADLRALRRWEASIVSALVPVGSTVTVHAGPPKEPSHDAIGGAAASTRSESPTHAIRVGETKRGGRRGPVTSTAQSTCTSTYSLTLPNTWLVTGPFAVVPITSKPFGSDAMWSAIAVPASSSCEHHAGVVAETVGRGPSFELEHVDIGW